MFKHVKRNIFLVFIKTNSIFEDKTMNHICRAKKCNLKHPKNVLVMLQTINKYINGQLFLPQDHKMNKSHQYQSIFGVNRVDFIITSLTLSDIQNLLSKSQVFFQYYFQSISPVEFTSWRSFFSFKDVVNMPVVALPV